MGTKAAQVANEAWLEQLSNPATQKTAVAGLDKFIRAELREEGAYRKILPMEQAKDENLVPWIGTDAPVLIQWKEPRSVGAMTIPFAGNPRGVTIRGENFPIFFNTIVGPRYMKDVNSLRVYPYDIRQVLTDHCLRDIQEEEDRRWFVDTVDAVLGTVNTASPATGYVQYRGLSGGWGRENVVESMKIIRGGPTKTAAALCVINSVTAIDFMKWGFDEVGGDKSQDILWNGDSSWAENEFLNVKWLITIKHGLVGNGTIYQFGQPEYMGYSYYLTDVTMYAERHAERIEFYPFETIGGALGNFGAIGRADLTA